MVDAESLKSAFKSLATSYCFLASCSSSSSPSLSAVKALSENLGRPITTNEIIYLSMVAPALIEFKYDQEYLKICLPLKRKRAKTAQSRIELIDSLCSQFNAMLTKYFNQVDNPVLQLTSKQVVDKVPVKSRILNIEEICDSIANDPLFKVVSNGYWSMPVVKAAFGTLNTPLEPNIIEALHNQNITQLYSHQADAINALQNGSNIILTTATSSGKSLVYQIPIFIELQRNPLSRFLLIFPTKALAEDQRLRLIEFAQIARVDCKIETFDGDTPFNTRLQIQNCANIILTNPDMLHLSILPLHEKWTMFMANLKFVMIDEVHYYHGQMGGHLAHVIQRLLRICRYYGNNNVKFIGCSATISEPISHFKSLVGELELKLIDNDGSPYAPKTHVVLEPTGHFLNEIVKVASYLISNRIKTIVFTKTRKYCEIVLKELREYSKRNGFNENLILSYRGGYSVQDRRKVEQKLLNGDVILVVATNALELGVDIGSLEAVIHCGFPKTVASFYQQSGRAGRRGNRSLDILILDRDNMNDLVYIKDINLIKDQRLQRLVVDTEDESIMAIHANCAAKEIHISPDDPLYFEPDSLFEDVCLSNLRFDEMKKVYIPLAKYLNEPAKMNPLRVVDDCIYKLINVRNNQLVEEIEESRVAITLYSNAIHLHHGITYLITNVDHSKKEASCEPVVVDYVTLPHKAVNFEPIKADYSADCRVIKHQVHTGPILKSVKTHGYKKMNPKTKFVFEVVENVFHEQIHTKVYGLWIDIQHNPIMNLLEYNQSIHTIHHCMLILAPVFATDSMDLSTQCFSQDRTTRVPRLLIYDKRGQRSTINAVSKSISAILKRSQTLLENCSCEYGCDGCVYSAGCHVGNTNLNRKAAILLLKLF